jgi:hypothetical protein
MRERSFSHRSTPSSALSSPLLLERLLTKLDDSAMRIDIVPRGTLRRVGRVKIKVTAELFVGVDGKDAVVTAELHICGRFLSLRPRCSGVAGGNITRGRL